MRSEAHDFKHRAERALLDPNLKRAMARAKGGFVDKRALAAASLPEWSDLCETARAVKEHALAHLDYYLERFERELTARGGTVHWAETPAEARAIIARICSDAGAKRVTKGKSMVAEEIALNEHLEAAGMEVLETDLGEYIIQLAGEPPSHIIAPAMHKNKDEISDLFHEHHSRHGLTERQTDAAALVADARKVLREGFLSADVGITGANFLVAETGSVVLVTNEGNGDLTNTLPDVHIVTAGIEKIVPTLEDVSSILRVLARSATGQEMSVYTTFSTGARREADPDGPREMHVVLIDNGRSRMLGNEYHPMLRCIRCGACMNHCPVYQSAGGHAYGWVYVGPMGSVLTPLMVGLDGARDLPHACTLNGRCREVCPMGIPLPGMLRELRTRGYEQNLDAPAQRRGLALWAFLARRPSLYRWTTEVAVTVLGFLGRRRGRFRSLPGAGAWTASRDLPAPTGETFQSMWQRRRHP